MSRARLLALLGVLVAWAVVSYANLTLAFVNPVLLPTPGQVAAVFADAVRDGSLPQHVATSLVRVNRHDGVVGEA